MAKFVTIRALFALATIYDWEIMQLDVKTAFLYPALYDKVYMELPEGYNGCAADSGSDNAANGGSDKVCQLKKSMHGLKQAPQSVVR